MTQSNRNDPELRPGEISGAARTGEVVISGVDTGPRNDERANLTPTEDHARFQPQLHPAEEPDNEDG